MGRINQDFQNNLYDVYHLNFISPISRQKLEDLASAAIAANCVANIHKVRNDWKMYCNRDINQSNVLINDLVFNLLEPHLNLHRIQKVILISLKSILTKIHKIEFQVYDQYVNFITLEDDMFILKHQNSDSMSYYSK